MKMNYNAFGRIARSSTAALCCCSVILITGCGGGGGGGSSNGSDGNAPPATVAVAGVAIDGYLAGSTIRCLDANGNEIARTTTGTVAQSNPGQWSLSLPQGARCHTIEASGGDDVGLGDGSTPAVPVGAAVYRARVDHLSAAEQTTGRLAVSPLTSLIAELQAANPAATPATARSAVLQAFAIGGAVDPLRVDPIATGNTDLFKAGNIAATTIREVTNGIINAIAASGATTVSESSRAAINAMARRNLASQLSPNGAVTNDLAGLLRTVAGSTYDALTTDSQLGQRISALPKTLTVLTLSEYAVGIVGRLATGSSLAEIAQTAADQGSSEGADQRLGNLLGELFSLNQTAPLESIASSNAAGFLQSLRDALAKPADEKITLIIPGFNDDGNTDQPIEVDTGITSYLEIAGQKVTVLTTGPDFEADLSTFASDTGVVAPAGVGSLSGVAVQINQSAVRPQLGATPRKVNLGFTVARTETSPLFLSAVVRDLGLTWGPGGLGVDTTAATLYASVAFNSSSVENSARIDTLPQNLVNSLVQIDSGGQLAINLESLVKTLGGGDTIFGLLRSGRFSISAVLSDPAGQLVFAEQGTGGKRIAVPPVTVTVSKAPAGTAGLIQMTGTGFTGSIRLP